MNGVRSYVGVVFHSVRLLLAARILLLILLSVRLRSHWLSILLGKDGEALLGDLLERRHILRRKLGSRRAGLWYLCQILCSIPPITWCTVKRLSGLQEMLKRIGR